MINTSFEHSCIYMYTLAYLCVSAVCPTGESVSGWSTLFHTSRCTIKLNFALLVSFHDGGGHYRYFVTVGALNCLPAGLYK